MGRPASGARDRALSAALAIVCRDGGKALTIDAVAKEAGVSKGGVLHHFSTKDALIREVVLSMTSAWEAAVQLRCDEDPNPVGRYVRAFLDAMRDPAIVTVGRGLLAAVALDLALLDPLRESYSRCHTRIENDGLDPVTAYLCALVADALWFGAIFNLPAPPAELLTELNERLLAASRGDTLL